MTVKIGCIAYQKIYTGYLQFIWIEKMGVCNEENVAMFSATYACCAACTDFQ